MSVVNQIMVKDPIFQQGTSFAVIVSFLLYNILNKSLEFERVASTYPKISSNDNKRVLWTNHILWFMNLTLKIYWWTFVSLLLTFVVLILILYLVVFVLKFDTDVFLQMSKGIKSNALLSLSNDYIKNSPKHIGTGDLFALIFSFATQKYKIMMGILIGSVLLAITFSVIVISPKYMVSKKNRRTNVRLYLTTLLMFTLFISTLLVLTNR